MTTVPAFTRHLLDNGLEVLLCRDAHLPIVSSMLWYRVGSRDERAGHTGVSHFLEHMLFKGSTRFGKGSIDQLTLSCGGSNNAFTWLDATAYDFSLPAAHWELALEIEADRMQGALLDPQEISAEKAVILEEWQSAQDDPDENLWESLNSLALQQHPYRQPILGWPDDLRNLEREELLGHYRTYYHPNHATLVLVGDLPDNALERIVHHLGALPRGPERPPASGRWQEPSAPGERRLWRQRSDIQLPRLVVTWPAPALTHPDYLPMQLLQYVLAEGWSSRLHQVLVEETGLATEVGAVLFATQDPYLFWLQLELSPGVKAARVEKVLFAELASVAAGSLPASAFARAHQQMLTDFYLGQETTADRAQFAGETVTSGSWELFQNYAERLAAVSEADVLRVAQTYLTAEQRTLGWLWPSEKSEATGLPTPPLKPVLPLRHRPSPPAPQTVSPPRLVLPPRLPQLASLRQVLPQGLTTLLHVNRRTPLVSIELQLPAGSLHDPPRQSGLAGLTLASLVKGTTQKKAREFSEALENHGSSLSLAIGLTGASLQLETLSSQLLPVLELLHEAITTPRFENEEIRKERALLLAGLRGDEESTGYRAQTAFVEHVYADTPAARPVDGSLESVKGLRSQQVRRFYSRHYQPEGSILALAGDFDPEQLQPHLENCWGSWQAGRAVAPLQTWPFARQQGRYYRHIDLPEREQCTLLWGHLGVNRQHPDLIALLLLDVILGNGPGFASRIPRRLRDELGLAYYISLSTTVGAHRYPGLVQAQVECAPDKTEACLRGILEEVRRLQQDGVSPAELEAAQAYLGGRFAFLFETNVQRSGYLLQRENFGWPDDYLVTWLQRLQALTPADLLRVAREHIDTQSWTLITAGPRPNWNEDLIHDC
ncbi:MAG: M16 family metallopeptidase [Candidatus Sericytochromatia bacterium]